MTPAAWTALALWALVLIVVVVAIFIIRLLLRFERIGAHLDFTLGQIDGSLPPMLEQSRHTLESVEHVAEQARGLMMRIEVPLSRLGGLSQRGMPAISPQLIAAIIGFIKGLHMFKRIFSKRHKNVD